MADEIDLSEYDRLTNKLNKVYPNLMAVAAAEAMNFSKERFQRGVDIRDVPFVPRKSNKDRGRAILVGKGSGTLKHDVQVISVNENEANIGTTETTVPYAKAHNEGFKGTVTVDAHTRIRTKKVKETYVDRNGKTRNRTSKQVDTGKGDITVRTYNRKMNLPQRQFLGESTILDARIEKAVGGKIIDVINNFQ